MSGVPPTVDPSLADRWMPLAATLAIQSLVSMALIALPVIAPVVSRAVGVSTALVGVYVALVYAGAMAASLTGGAAVARWGALRVSQTGLALCAAGLTLCALPSVPAIAAGAILIGLGYGPITPASSHLLVRTTPAHRMSLVFSLKQTGVPLGGMLAGAIVPGVAAAFGWQAGLITVALAALAVAVLVQPLRAELDADRNPARQLSVGSLGRPVRLVLRHRTLTVLAGCSFLFSMLQLSLTTYLVAYLHEDVGIGLVAAGLALSAAQIAGVVGRVFWGWLSDRMLGAPRMLALVAVLMAAGTIGTGLVDASMPVPIMLAILSLFGATALGWNGIYIAELARQAPAGTASVATGGGLAVTFLGVVLGPPLFGALSAGFGGYALGYLALAVPALASAVLLIRFRREFDDPED